MKNFLKKTIGIGLIVFILILLPTCKSGTETTANKAGFRQYISAYTSGIISKESIIKIKLISSFAEKIKKTDEALSDLFSFSPSIDGKAYWADDNSLEFKPSENLKSDEKYTVEFNLGELSEVPSDLEEFIFNFQTIKQNFDVEFNEIQTTDLKKFTSQKILGSVKTADSENIEIIKKIISASQNDKKLDISWESDGLTHNFEIDKISRANEKSSVTLKWNGEEAGIDNSGQRFVKVPSLSKFKVLFTRLVSQPEQYVFVQFSDPLNQNQDLEGLVKIQGQSYVRTIVDGNTLKIYPTSRLDGSYRLDVGNGIKNSHDKKLENAYYETIAFQEMKPAVQLIGKGNILPSSANGLVFPFEAVNLKAVDVQIIKIFETNVTQFLQVNNFGGDYQLKRVGKPVLRKTIKLDDKGIIDFNKWNRFSLDLNDLIETEPGAIYRISIGFRQKHAIYSCATEEDVESEDLKSFDEEWDPEDDTESSYWDMYSGDYYYYDYYSEGYSYDEYWNNKENPCHRAFYGKNRSVAQNIIASNLGIIAKKGNNGEINVFVTDIRSTEPLAEIEVEVLDYQNQILATAKTSAEGKAEFQKLDKPYFVVAKKGKERGYLKINDGNSLSLSKFDVSGTHIKEGVKGFIYGERGVWRPGDSIFVTFILQEDNELPKKHPVVFELKDSRSQLITRIIEKKNESGFYSFKIKTEQDAPTGNWGATIKVGGSSFYQKIKIETIKPNRLKIKLDLETTELSAASENAEIKLNVKWLHGAIAKNLKAKVDVSLSPSSTTFPKYSEYIFEDPTKNFYSKKENVFEGKIDDQGNATFIPSIQTKKSSAGKLKATFVTRVYEKGGDFSIDQQTIDYSPYSSYVGIKLPKGDKTRGMLLTDQAHKVEVVLLSSKGKPITENHQLEFSFYKLNWRWWWDNSDAGLANYTSRSSVQALKTKKVSSSGGKASWSIQINEPDWGRYLVRVKDLTSGHSSAKVVYIDWPGWAGRAQKEGSGATILNFSSDKQTYQTGEEITLTIPSNKGARALVSIESGSKVIESHWVKTKAEQTEFTFKASKEMSPNIYVYVTMLQPHAQTENDLPIRLYGIIPISVEDPETKLEPQISMPNELEAEKEFTVTVSEKNNRPMTYTLAIVDEGLLDLTRFKTPEPWNTFYAREAIGVNTWDIYDWVIGAYGNKISHLLSIGGDEGNGKAKNKKANRFKPVVKFLGPFTMKSGKKTHKIKMPRYVGSVRTMLIAGYDGAYGQAEKTTPVTKPVMVIGTMPRVLGTGESLKLPVNIFVMKDNIKTVNVQLKTNKLLKIVGSSKKTISFSEKGEQMLEFDLNSLQAEGIATVEIIASSGNHKSTYELELDVRNPNPLVNNVKSKVLNAGESWTTDFSPIGIKGTNTNLIEVASIPPINLEKRIKYLIKYPYGCVEQTTSSVFPQLYLSDFVKLDKKRQADIEKNVKSGIKRLSQFQHYSGGLGYWPNSNNVDDWGTCYAGHFMLEAQKKGYNLQAGFLDKWLKYQKKTAQNWTDKGNRSQFIQAYRLYTLALAGKPVRGAMNRLRENKNLTNDAKWRLAAAYKLAGKQKFAELLIENATKTVSDYKEMSNTYGSSVRDKAMILETLVLLGKNSEAFTILKEISIKLSTDRWMSTQTTAYSLFAIAGYIQKNKANSDLKYSYSVNGASSKTVSESMSLSSVKLATNESANQKITVKNTSKGILHVSLVQSGIPPVGEETSGENKLNMKMVFRNMDGDIFDVSSLTQGTEFIAEITVKNPTNTHYKNMALTQIFPAGWEIMNTRLFNFGNLGGSSTPTYTDIRDDRVYSYFDLNRGSSKTFRILLSSSYLGNYYLPAQYCEAMYDGTIYSRQKGQWINVVKPGE